MCEVTKRSENRVKKEQEGTHEHDVIMKGLIADEIGLCINFKFLSSFPTGFVGSNGSIIYLFAIYRIRTSSIPQA